MSSDNKPRTRVLIFVVAYFAETTISKVLERIPASKLEQYEIEVLVIDDGSADTTFSICDSLRKSNTLPFKVVSLKNPVNQGYGGNQKVGYRYAIDHKFDIVVLLHGDGQYAPELLPELLKPIDEGNADVVFGSRMMRPMDALKGGMPVYKFVGNKILTVFENWMLGTKISEFHSGYRVYRVAALAKVPFEWNTNVFHFDTEIIIQFCFAKFRIMEVPIPTFYGDEICRVNGMRYAMDCVRAVIAARLQSYYLLYRRNFDVGQFEITDADIEKLLDAPSAYSGTVGKIRAGSKVLPLCKMPKPLEKAIEAKGATMLQVDKNFNSLHLGTAGKECCGTTETTLIEAASQADNVILFDSLNHAENPEAYLDAIHKAAQRNPNTVFIITVPNVAFFVVRFMLMIGHFNYTKRGILNLLNTRLFTAESLERLLIERGFLVDSIEGIPAPYPLVIKTKSTASFFTKLNVFFIKISKSCFSYQFIATARVRPSVANLLRTAESYSESIRK